jgi:selenocysteine-specific elongation factor
MQHFEQLKQRLARYCEIELERRRPTTQVPLPVILSAMSRHASPNVLETLLDAMTAKHELVRRGDRVGLPSGADLSNRQRTLLNTVLTEIAHAGSTPPTLKELAERHSYPMADLERLVQVAIDEGRLVRVSPQLVLCGEALDSLRQRLAAYFQKHPAGSVSEIREHWQMTRKHAVPILEYFDQRQITTRAGDLRSAGPRLSLTVDEVPA